MRLLDVVAHLAYVPDPDSLVVIASNLRSYEAGMIRGLLESAGIPADVIDTVARRGDSFLSVSIDCGAKVVVRAGDAERAREIIDSAGVLPGKGPNEPVEIPEEGGPVQRCQSALPVRGRGAVALPARLSPPGQRGCTTCSSSASSCWRSCW